MVDILDLGEDAADVDQGHGRGGVEGAKQLLVESRQIITTKHNLEISE